MSSSEVEYPLLQHLTDQQSISLEEVSLSLLPPDYNPPLRETELRPETFEDPLQTLALEAPKVQPPTTDEDFEKSPIRDVKNADGQNSEKRLLS